MKMFGAAAVAAVMLAAAATAAAAQNVSSDSGVAQPRRAVSAHSHPTYPAKANKRPAAARSAGPFASAPSVTASKVRAATAFDGSWSVLIVSREGACDATFRYGVEISNGNVINAGGAPVSLAGRVAPNGVIQVSVAAGDQQARGVGRLSRTTGSGTWRGAGSRGFCAGTWAAERRG